MEKSEVSTEQSRKAYVDIIRIIACLMVIFNHTSDRGFNRYALDEIKSVSWVLDTFVSSLCKVGVPLFFMIAGANLLGKTETYKKTFMRARRIILCLIIWSGVYFFLDAFMAGGDQSVRAFIKMLVSQSYWHLWFLYFYIGFIIALPLLRYFAQNIDQNGFYLLLAIGFILTVLDPIAEVFFVPVHGGLKPSWVISDIVLYPVVGYYLDNKIVFSKVTKKQIYGLWVINALIFALGGYCEYRYLSMNPGDRSEAFLRAACLINAITIFMTTKYIDSEALRSKGDGFKKRVVFLGKKTFGIYLIHILILWKIPLLLNLYEKIESIGRFGIYVSVLICFIISGLITCVLDKIPVIKEIV